LGPGRERAPHRCRCCHRCEGHRRGEALALGARRAILVEADPGQRLDALVTARALALAIKKLGNPGIVLTGAESADAQQGLLGPMLAEVLGLELVAGATRIESGASAAVVDLAAKLVGSGALLVHRTAGGDDERLLAQAPLLVTVSPRFQPSAQATSWGVGEAYTLPLDTWSLRDLAPQGLASGSDLAALSRVEKPRTEAERFEGDADEAAGQLVRRLRSAGVVP